MSPRFAGSWLQENRIKVGNSHDIQIFSAAAAINSSPGVGNAGSDAVRVVRLSVYLNCIS